MINLGPKRLMTPADFHACPVWRYDEDEDRYHPVLTENDLPESERDLSFLATFTTPKGKEIDGYVVGISRVFSIGLFGGDRFYHANKNLQTETKQWMNEFILEHSDPEIRSLKDILPLRYRTRINRDGYRDFLGVFDLRE